MCLCNFHIILLLRILALQPLVGFNCSISFCQTSVSESFIQFDVLMIFTQSIRLFLDFLLTSSPSGFQSVIIFTILLSFLLTIDPNQFNLRAFKKLTFTQFVSFFSNFIVCLYSPVFILFSINRRHSSKSFFLTFEIAPPQL